MRDLESRKGRKNIFQKFVDKATAPIKGLLSTVLGGLFNILTGKFVMGLIDFITKPKNIERTRTNKSKTNKAWDSI